MDSFSDFGEESEEHAARVKLRVRIERTAIFEDPADDKFNIRKQAVLFKF